ncbi:MAG: pilus assembly protein [Pseudomonas sp. PGPPP1]|uniref:molecular chaperone n=1 Tax=Pseudomonas TaxID=286 RepID=UPI000BC3E844|nr:MULTISPECIES: molecular chaperone [Pseudomonas]OYU08500.1 MAG: pilus assembly protein [Pseudomonas sp. PGPPP1]
MKFIYVVIGTLLLSLNVYAGPSLQIGQFYDFMPGSQSSFLKRIHNSGTSTAFVKIEVKEIFYEKGGAREEPLKVVEGSTRDGLVASPARLIVPAKGTQGTRLLYTGDRSKERYFRVRFLPVVPEKEDKFAVSEAERETYEKNMSAGFNVMAGYGMVFFVRPSNTRFETKIDDGAKRYIIKNNGNSVVVIEGLKDCSASDEDKCAATRKVHLIPGLEYAFDKQPGRVYRYNLIEGDKKTPVSVKGL